MKDKLEIIKIISKKIKGTDHKDFKFYQAYYSALTGNIEAREQDILNKIQSYS